MAHSPRTLVPIACWAPARRLSLWPAAGRRAESERCHHDGAQTKLAGLQRGCNQALTLLQLSLGELDDEDCVFRGQSRT